MGWRAILGSSALALSQFGATTAIAQESDTACRFNEESCIALRASESAVLYGLNGLDEFEGEQVRIFIVDAWGRDRRAFIVSRPFGASPNLAMHFAYAEPVIISETISGELWNSVIEQIAFIYEPLPEFPPQQEDGDRIVVCADGASSLIERRFADGRVARVAGHSCHDTNGGSGVIPNVFAEQIEALAATTFTHCADLDREVMQTPSFVLQQCSLLEGDTPAASEAMNLFETSLGTPRDAGLWERALDLDVLLVGHDGSTISGQEAVARHLVAIGEHFSPVRAVGVNARTALLEANLDLVEANPIEDPDFWILGVVLSFEAAEGEALLVSRIELFEPTEIEWRD